MTPTDIPYKGYRHAIHPSVSRETLDFLFAKTAEMRAVHPADAPNKPKPGHVIDRLVEHAKQTGFAPVAAAISTKSKPTKK